MLDIFNVFNFYQCELKNDDAIFCFPLVITLLPSFLSGLFWLIVIARFVSFRCQILPILDRFRPSHLQGKLVQPCFIQKCKKLNFYDFYPL